MYNLFRGEFYKLFRSKCFYFCGVAVLISVLSIYGMFALLENARSDEVVSDSYGVAVSVDGEAEISIWDGVAFTAILEAVSSAIGLVIATVFAAIYMYDLYANGAIKNIVGKGYSRCSVFLSKYIVTLAGCMILAGFMFVSVIVFDRLFVGVSRVTMENLWNVLAYIGMQCLLETAFVGIVMMIGQICRNLGVSIMISLVIIMFSDYMTSGVGALLKYFGFSINVHKYWIQDLIAECSGTYMENTFVVRAIVCALLWSVLAFGIGSIHFRKVDVK